MAAETTHTPVAFAEDGRPALPAGTRVTLLQGVTGTTVGEPALTSTGYVVTVQYDEGHAHLSPSGGADFAVQELKVISEAPQEESAAPADEAAPAAPRKGAREALGEASAPGWELLYDKPKQGCEVGRRYVDGKPQYSLICKAHLHVHELPRLTTERTVRTAGGWCPSCTK
ncbi:hypothetical protein ACFPC0_10605 [Streptomyces andamanensis]|uniref:DUF1918 domain-containing protein n=1 Tax=Streptomyces andamanensis TaxID=1565035 RepID=A0ABV8TCD6_9ACTN